ncbi:MAG: hypothetical protein HFG00_06980 [Oscillibacter sp.]|nr:hypothetical protein [Oscillibacter sp.]
MKRKKTLYLALVMLGLCLAAAALTLRDTILSVSMAGALMGSMTGIGLKQLLTLRLDSKDPAQARRKAIKDNDERNVAIRRRAKALSGDVLQWAVIAVAWASLGFDAPLWVPMAAVGIFVLKSVLEFCLTVRYQRQM